MTFHQVSTEGEEGKEKMGRPEGSAEQIYRFVQASRPVLELLSNRKMLLWTESLEHGKSHFD